MRNLDRSFFKSEMDKIFEQFPRATFSVRKLDLIYLSIKHLDSKQFANVTDFFIANSKFAPNVDDFKERARSFASQKGDLESCEICSQGIVAVYAKKTGVNYAFACTCISGTAYPAFQKWQQQKQSHFTRIAPRKIFMKGNGNPYEGKLPVRKP